MRSRELHFASVGPVVSEKIFENTHTHSLHTRTQQLRVVPDDKIWDGGRGPLKAKHYIFVWWGRRLFFQSSGQLAFVKMYNFLKVMVLHKNAVSSNGICWNEKKK